MSLTREDMLRELELLPVWQSKPKIQTTTEVLQQTQAVVGESLMSEEELKASAEPASPQKSTIPASIEQATAEPVAQEVVIEKPALEKTENIPHVIESADKISWAFVYDCPEELAQAAPVLLRNIANAMSLVKTDYQLVKVEPELQLPLAKQYIVLGDVLPVEVLGAQACCQLPSIAQMLNEPALKKQAWDALLNTLKAAE